MTDTDSREPSPEARGDATTSQDRRRMDPDTGLVTGGPPRARLRDPVTSVTPRTDQNTDQDDGLEEAVSSGPMTYWLATCPTDDVNIGIAVEGEPTASTASTACLCGTQIELRRVSREEYEETLNHDPDDDPEADDDPDIDPALAEQVDTILGIEGLTEPGPDREARREQLLTSPAARRAASFVARLVELDRRIEEEPTLETAPAGRLAAELASLSTGLRITAEDGRVWDASPVADSPGVVGDDEVTLTRVDQDGGHESIRYRVRLEAIR